MIAKVLATSAAATFNLGMQRTRENIFTFHALRAAGRYRFSAPASSRFLYKLGRVALIGSGVEQIHDGSVSQMPACPSER